MLRLHLGGTSLNSAAHEPFLSHPTASFISLSCTLRLLLLDLWHFFTCKATFQTRASPVQPLAGTLPPRLTARDQMRAAVEKQLLGTYSLFLVSSAPPHTAGFLSCSDFTVRTPGPVCRNHVLVQWQRWWRKWGPSSPVSVPFCSCARATVSLKHPLKTAIRPYQVFSALPCVTLKTFALGGQDQQMAEHAGSLSHFFHSFDF